MLRDDGRDPAIVNALSVPQYRTLLSLLLDAGTELHIDETGCALIHTGVRTNDSELARVIRTVPRRSTALKLVEWGFLDPRGPQEHGRQRYGLSARARRLLGANVMAEAG